MGERETPGASWTAPDGTTYTGPGTVGWAHNPAANKALVAAAKAEAARRAVILRVAPSSEEANRG